MQEEQWSSVTCGHGGREIMVAPSSIYGLRSYSMPHVATQQQQYWSDDKINKKGNYSMSWSRSSSLKGSVGWVFSDPELQRKKRVATYKAYSVEGKIKGSLKKTVRWFKDRYARAVYG